MKKYFHNMSLRTKLLLPIGFMAILVVASGFTIYMALQQSLSVAQESGTAASEASKDLERLASKEVRRIFSASAARDWLGGIAVSRSDVVQALWFAYGSYVENVALDGMYQRRIASTIKQLDSGFMKYEAEIKLEGKYKELYDQGFNIWAEQKAAIEALLENMKSGNAIGVEVKAKCSDIANKMLVLKDIVSESQGLLKNEVMKTTALTEVMAKQSSERSARIDSLLLEADAAGKRSRTLLWICVSAIVIAILITVFSVISIVRRVKVLAQCAKYIAIGDIDSVERLMFGAP